MPRRSSLASELMTIGFLSPLVMAHRLQWLALNAMRVSPMAQGEVLRMVAEKPLAFLSASMAFQAEMARFWFRGPGTFSTQPLEAALAPVRRRVQANNRRLGRR